MVWTLVDNGKLANQIVRLAAIVVKYLFAIIDLIETGVALWEKRKLSHQKQV